MKHKRMHFISFSLPSVKSTEENKNELHSIKLLPHPLLSGTDTFPQSNLRSDAGLPERF